MKSTLPVPSDNHFTLSSPISPQLLIKRLIRQLESAESAADEFADDEDHYFSEETIDLAREAESRLSSITHDLQEILREEYGDHLAVCEELYVNEFVDVDEHVERVLADTRYWFTQRHSYRQSGQREGHVFESLVALRNHVEVETKSPADYL